MPTAKSAAPTQSHTSTTDIQPRVADAPLQASTSARPRRRAWTALLGAALGLSFVLPAGTLVAPVVDARAGSNGCTGWTSTTRPPDAIRVLRRKNGRVERVPLRKYVITVMGKEWPSYLPQPVVEAGAVAVKQFAWYHAMGRTSRSKRGQCYDVTDGIGDQLYKPEKARVRPDHHRAYAATAGIRLLKGGRLFMTGYRRGSKANCGRDATGWKLYARSATRCARAGLGFREILRRYYSPNLEIIDGRGSAPQRSSQRATQRPAQTSKQSSSGRFTLIDDRSRQIRLSGSWWYTSARSAINRTLLRSSARGSSARFRFTGRELQLVGPRGPGRGKIDVYINGGRVARVDMRAARNRPQSVFFSKKWRQHRARVVKLVAVKTSHRSKVQLDAIRVR